jgi:hypothetical protein
MLVIPDYIIDDAVALREVMDQGKLNDATYIIQSAKRLVRDIINEAKEVSYEQQEQAGDQG